MTQDRPLEGKRILILEDDFYLAREEASLLKQAGAHVIGPFGTGFEVGDLAGVGRIDSAVIDINLGSGPNFDFARVLKGRGTPFVFVTGYDAASIPHDLSRAERLEKPIRESEFIAVIARSIKIESDCAKGGLHQTTEATDRRPECPS